MYVKLFIPTGKLSTVKKATFLHTKESVNIPVYIPVNIPKESVKSIL